MTVCNASVLHTTNKRVVNSKQRKFVTATKIFSTVTKSMYQKNENLVCVETANGSMVGSSVRVALLTWALLLLATISLGGNIEVR